MKKYFFIAIVAIVTVFGFSSCSHSNLNGVLNGTELNSANYEYVRPITSTAEATYIFGIGGGNVEQQAIEDLRKKANLKQNQALNNYSVTTDWYFFLPFVAIKTVTASADIVEFNE
ncbi:MAG: hypothetical protein II298_01975 [Bacteroidales bacterium]|nr:hypothetical protein [Bacteroidales bacterium]